MAPPEPTPPALPVGRIFTAKEVARILRLRSVRTVMKLFRARKLQYTRPECRVYLVSEAALLSYLARESKPVPDLEILPPRDPLAPFVAAQVKLILDRMLAEGWIKIQL